MSIQAATIASCSVCGRATVTACSDCRIDLRTTVYVCGLTKCMDTHEVKCPAKLMAARETEMLLVKACEHIAEGDDGWEKLRNECPSTMAVAALRDQLAHEQANVANLQLERGELLAQVARQDAQLQAPIREQCASCGHWKVLHTHPNFCGAGLHHFRWERERCRCSGYRALAEAGGGT